MNYIINLFITAFLIYGTHYGIKELLTKVEKTTIKKVKGGLSSSEQFAQKLTGNKLNF